MTPVDLETLKRDGVVRCRQHLSHRQMLEATQYLDARPTFNAHVKKYSDGVARSLDQTLAICHEATFDMADVVNAPHLLRFFLDHAGFARDYLEVDPVLYSINAFYRSADGLPDKSGTEGFHRDHDDSRFIALYLYGSDVTRGELGPHSYQKGTHRIAPDGEPYDSHGEEIVTGGPGQAFITDPRGLHKGIRPSEGRRLIFWARFGVSAKPESYVWDNLAPCTLLDRRLLDDEKTRTMLRLVAH